MPAPMKTQEFVRGELPYKILMALYENSRVSLRKIGRDLNISYHTVQETLKELEEKYGIVYTLDIDNNKLGFTDARIITVKFEIKPNLVTLKESLQKDSFIQDAYLAEGDFDLLLYVIGLSKEDFQQWQWNLRVALSDYRPVFKFAVANRMVIGFIPIKSELIGECSLLNNKEKEVLGLLNENSRMKLSEITKRAKINKNKATYIIKKLQSTGIIKHFVAVSQNIDKKIVFAYNILLVPTKDHARLWRTFKDKLFSENLHETTNNYSLFIETNGPWDAFFFCTFSDGEALSINGADMLQDLWKLEGPRIEKAVITSCIVGKWPFHLEAYKLE